MISLLKKYTFHKEKILQVHQNQLPSQKNQNLLHHQLIVMMMELHIIEKREIENVIKEILD